MGHFCPIFDLDNCALLPLYLLVFSVLYSDDKDHLSTLYSAIFRELARIQLQKLRILTKETLNLVIIGTK